MLSSAFNCIALDYFFTLLQDEVLCVVLLQIDGSLCGYVNKAFSQRPNTKESFQVWNARQARKHGVLIDFGEFQSTYSNGGAFSR